MPPFQYETYRNPYGPSIAEALQRQGDVTAAGALRAGEIEGEAARQQGAIQRQMWGGLGQGIAAIPQQMAQNRELALREQQQRQQMAVTGMTLEDRQRQRDADTQIGKLLDATPRGPNGTYDVRAFTSSLPGDLAKYAQPYIDHLNTVNSAWDAEDTKRRGQFQQSAAGLLQAGAPFLHTQNLIDTGERDHVLTPEQATNARRQLIDGGDPEAVLRTLIGPQKLQFVGADQRGLDPITGAVRVEAQGKPGEGEYTLGDQRYNAQHQPVGPKATPTLTADERVASLMGREAAGETLNAADKAVLEGWKLKEGSKPFTVKTVENGRPVERVMTQGEAMKQGLFQSPPTAAERTADTALVRVEHQDAQGNTVVEWMPKSEVRGQTFKKGTSAALQNRLASATAVNQTGNDIIARLSDPATASQVGPIMGRFNSLREFLGAPPPELAELAGQIESYALANMGVHGMRSVEGAAKINKMLDSKTTPAGLIATIKGLQGFSTHLLENEGRTVPSPGTPPPAATGANPFRTPAPETGNPFRR